MATMYAHVHEEPEPLEHLRPDCPEGLRAAVMRMLAKEVGDRWPSVEDVIAAIGSPSFTPDDPTRSQLMAIAKTGQRLGIGVTTPKSPIPLVRTPSPLRISTGGASASTTLPPQTSDATGGIAVHPRRTSALSVALAVGGVLVGIGSIVVALQGRSPARPDRPPETGAATVATPAVPSAPGLPTPALPTQAKPLAGVSPQPAAKPPLPSPTRAESLPAAPVSPPAAEREAVEAAIASYASALDSSSAAAAQRAFPAMPDSQQTSLTSFFAGGGHITTLWRVTDVRVEGDRATARIRGANRIEPADSAPTVRPVNLRAVLERTPDGWQLRSLGGAGTH